MIYVVGCVGLLLETIHPFPDCSPSLLLHLLRIVEVLGAYRYTLLCLLYFNLVKDD